MSGVQAYLCVLLKRMPVCFFCLDLRSLNDDGLSTRCVAVELFVDVDSGKLFYSVAPNIS